MTYVQEQDKPERIPVDPAPREPIPDQNPDKPKDGDKDK